MVPPERVELSFPASEAGTLSTELQGHCMAKNIMVAEGPTRLVMHSPAWTNMDKPQAPH